jgi:hypothetical protein
MPAGVAAHERPTINCPATDAPPGTITARAAGATVAETHRCSNGNEGSGPRDTFKPGESPARRSARADAE